MSRPAQLAAEIEALSPPERFRLVADLLEAQRPKLALSIARRATADLGAALALRRPKPRKVEGT